MVNSPAEARALLFTHLTPTTPLIGHALENDLNVTRIIHPCIVDTVLLFPHYIGLPMRNGLRMLVKQCLDRDIQVGGDRGHDSKEDARAAGDLVRIKIKEQWKLLTKAGWTVKAGKFLPPTTSAEKPTASAEPPSSSKMPPNTPVELAEGSVNSPKTSEDTP